MTQIARITNHHIFTGCESSQLFCERHTHIRSRSYAHTRAYAYDKLLDDNSPYPCTGWFRHPFINEKATTKCRQSGLFASFTLFGKGQGQRCQIRPERKKGEKQTFLTINIKHIFLTIANMFSTNCWCLCHREIVCTDWHNTRRNAMTTCTRSFDYIILKMSRASSQHAYALPLYSGKNLFSNPRRYHRLGRESGGGAG